MNKKIRILLILCLTALCVLTLAACERGESADTDADTVTSAPTDPVSDAPTEAGTVPETEPETEAETLPPEDLSLPDGYLRLLDAAHQKASKKESHEFLTD